jgi:hypothetical protein
MPSWKKKKTKNAKGNEGQNNDPSPAQLKAAKAIILEVETRDLKRERKSAKEAIEDGMDLIKAEQMLFGKGQNKRGNWGKYLKEFDSHLKPRTIQRYIQLAKNVDLKKNSTLVYIGQANLLKLIQLGDGKTPAKVLYDGDMDINFDPEDADARKQFQSEVAALIKQLETERRESKAEESSKEPGEEAEKMLKNFYELLLQPKELKGLKDRLEENEDLQARNKSVRIKLRKLPPEITKG